MSRLFTPGRALQRAAGVPELLWAINVSVLAGNTVAESAIPNVLAIDLDLVPRVFDAHAARTIRNHPAPRHRSGGRKRRSVLEYAGHRGLREARAHGVRVLRAGRCCAVRPRSDLIPWDRPTRMRVRCPRIGRWSRARYRTAGRPGTPPGGSCPRSRRRRSWRLWLSPTIPTETWWPGTAGGSSTIGRARPEVDDRTECLGPDHMMPGPGRRSWVPLRGGDRWA